MYRFIAFFICSFLSIQAFAALQVEVRVKPAHCFVGQPCELQGYHTVSIQNDTNENQYYHYRLMLCADTGDCYHKEETFLVNAHGFFDQKWDSSVITRFVNADKRHWAYAQTEVTGADHKIKDIMEYVTLSG